MKFHFLIVVASISLTSCSTQLADYKGTSPEFSLTEYFNGQVTAWGIVEDYSKKLTRRFCVDIIGSWEPTENGMSGTLDETFYYADGETQTRIWRLNISPSGEVTGTAGDVIGTATGKAEGTAFNWEYTLTVPVSGTTWEFAVDDWMYMMDNNRLMNRSYLSKWGVTVAEISIFFDKTQPVRTCRSE
ncbi:DUF3833 domain-containing protein [Aestuariibacter sp. AA17]|uniref:DUF3833 domain-containing protein n=1 Tax=Fluctibacter corallii TaxID=2984329 RepID=A0ABT3A3F1_9ALTE|nr:DUF3833 domain-containing protein [Aestuariibacter sp. AA17]MCV2883206.1 DUF3833 domain-containing protein [Aestuariibacter sp. AA17]